MTKKKDFKKTALGQRDCSMIKVGPVLSCQCTFLGPATTGAFIVHVRSACSLSWWFGGLVIDPKNKLEMTIISQPPDGATCGHPYPSLQMKP